jgi:hypothetical protein
MVQALLPVELVVRVHRDKATMVVLAHQFRVASPVAVEVVPVEQGVMVDPLHYQLEVLVAQESLRPSWDTVKLMLRVAAVMALRPLVDWGVLVLVVMALLLDQEHPLF